MFDRREIPKGARVALKLPAALRDTLLERLWVPPALLDRLRKGKLADKEYTFDLTLDELAQLADLVGTEANRTKDSVFQDRLDEIYGRIMFLLDAYQAELTPEEVARDEEILASMPDMLREGIIEILEDPAVQTPQQVQDRLIELSKAVAHYDDPELGSLSPQQVLYLLQAPWLDEPGPIRVNTTLTPNDLDSAPIFVNARTVLRAMAEPGGVRATEAANLNRKFVERMCDELRLPDRYVSDTRSVSKVINEEDIFPLHTLRVLLEIGKLIGLEKKRFYTTELGAELLEDRNAGILYTHLFGTLFTAMNLAYFDVYDDVPEVQQGVAFSLYAVAKGADTWQPIDEFAPRLLLPFVKYAIPKKFQYITESSYVKTRILYRLEDFGLVEFQRKDTPYRDTVVAVRKTPLFDRFLTFDPTLPDSQ